MDCRHLIKIVGKESLLVADRIRGERVLLNEPLRRATYQRTVLVVDDEPLIRMALADCRVDEGYAVLEASNVLEAVAVLGRHQIDALITDVDMPGALNGFDLMKLVSNYEAGVAVIATSGGHSAAEIEGEQVCFLAKPYRIEAVLMKLENRMASVRYPADFLTA